MTIPKSAIEKAISGGWYVGGKIDYRFLKEGFVEIIPTGLEDASDDDLSERHKFTLAEIALDPTFWQALGKALGWPTIRSIEGQAWQRNAHRFYDLILQGQSTEEFWDKLLGV